jgi:hypothetical protein
MRLVHTEEVTLVLRSGCALDAWRRLGRRGPVAVVGQELGHDPMPLTVN